MLRVTTKQPVETLSPFRITHHVIIATDFIDLFRVYYLSYSVCSAYCFSLRTIGIKPRAAPIAENIVANKKGVFKNVKGKANCMAIDIIGFDTVLDEVVAENLVKGKTAT